LVGIGRRVDLRRWVVESRRRYNAPFFITALYDRGSRRQPQYLPAYSPDLDPIEQAFAKLKALLRTEAAIDRFQPAECANYFANSGYLRSE
jgi:transposase